MPDTIPNIIFQQKLEEILRLLRFNPSAITASQATFLRQNANPKDERTAAIITAIEAFVGAHQAEETPYEKGRPDTQMAFIVDDLNSVLDNSKTVVVTPEVLRNAQVAVSSEYFPRGVDTFAVFRRDDGRRRKM
jgi:hypothetical protein